ncbi:MAG: DUF4338 domain-containing protein [Gemmatimonadetes bacterium]|nr:DUF4338 domain-containing protein [Gemmatimonadota bacterium]
METLQIHTDLSQTETLDFNFDNKPIEERVKLSIMHDLLRLDWKVEFSDGKVEVTPPEYYDKNIIRQSMGVKRSEIIRNNRTWIDAHIDYARDNLADGASVLQSKIRPVIEVCKKRSQHNLFRFFRYYWSSPYSEYVGRRIKLIIRDAALPNRPVIGIAALGSPIIHIPERDDYIGWDKKTRTDNLIYAMDAYVIGALPPYNHLLGGKLVSYILASDEVRKIYRDKYKDRVTLISKRKSSNLVCLFTTSLYGRSSQYNRLKYDNQLLYQPIGETRGYGTLHLTENTINLMRKYLDEKGISVGYKFGDGPSWRMRLIRVVGDLLGFNSDFLLKHSFKRKIYFVSLAKNSIEVLNGRTKRPQYYHRPKTKISEYWRVRWLNNRKKNPLIKKRVLDFDPKYFDIT